MSWHLLLGAVACAGHLALALVVWLRRDQASLALPLSLLFVDTFTWTFADLVFKVTGQLEWHAVDHVFSSFLPALMVHVIVGFVGRLRTERRLVRAIYAGSSGIALFATSGAWGWVVLVFGVSCTLLCSALLLKHRRQQSDGEERARTTLLLVAVLLGALLSTTNLWVHYFPLLPRLSHVGMLPSLGLVAACVLRLRLLGREVPGLLATYALLSGALLVVACMVLVRYLPPRGALLAVLLLAAIAVALAAFRELGRSRSAAAERVEKLVALGRFSEQLAHDLRNPLAALKGAVQFLLVEREQGRSLDNQTAFLELMLEQVEHVHRAVETYQRIANVEAIKQLTSLNELVEGVLAMQRFASTSEVTVRARLEPSLPPCELDRELLTTTLENLLRNAFEAMPSGGTITVETRSLKSNAGLEGVLIRVNDQGEGMDARVLERATDQFFTTKATGSGLGLSFAERVARAHDGRLELSSEVGRGTTVQIWMPRQPVC